MQESPRPHRIMRVTEYNAEVGINNLTWLACLPDLNPIEHQWSMRVRDREEAFIQEN